MQNVYDLWKPLDFGNPLRDATVTYAVPALERVSLSSNDQGFRHTHARSGDSAFPAPPSLVIPATPKERETQQHYSIYGPPDINYSELYDRPDQPRPSHSAPLPAGRTDPSQVPHYLRKYFDLAVGSRSADEFQQGSAPSINPLETNERRRVDHSRRRFGGGLQYITPPNRQSNDYFYYSDDSTYYKAKLSGNPENDPNYRGPHAAPDVISRRGTRVSFFIAAPGGFSPV